ncbi:MAG: AAA family ATPase [Acidobacteriota bacterium]
MQIVRLQIERFRAIREATIFPTASNALLGPNNIGKTAVLEALNLLLTSHGSTRSALVDENDFYQRQYVAANGTAPAIKIEAVLTGLTDEDADLFDGVLVPWSAEHQNVVERAESGTDPFVGAERAIRPCFEAWFDAEEDAFTWLAFHRTDLLQPREKCERFTPKQKRAIGFLIYRDFRALHRPITLEPTGLFDRVLTATGSSARNFEAIFDRLAGAGGPLVEDDAFKSSLTAFADELARYLPVAPGEAPLRFEATDRTRTQARATLQLYVEGPTALPLQKHGAGTRSLAVLAMLLVILRTRGRGILALEEPETFLFPHAQRRVIEEVQRLAQQLFVTTHSPTILERLPITSLHRMHRAIDDTLTMTPVASDTSIVKNVRRRLRRQLAEAFLGRAAVVVEEEATRIWLLQASSLLHGQVYDGEVCEAFDLAGISVISADGNGQVPELCDLLQRAGVTAFGLIDATKGISPVEASKFPMARIVHHDAMGLEDLLVASLGREAITAAMTEGPYVKEHSLTESMTALDAPAFDAKAREFLRHNKGSIPFHEWLADRTPLATMPVALRKAVVLGLRVAGGREHLTSATRAL